MVEIDNRTTNASGHMPSQDFFIEEGDFVRNEYMDTDEGWKRGGVFAKRAYKGQEMMLFTGADRAVTPLTAGGIAIGRLRTQPDGTIPTANAASGTYPRRTGTLDLYGELDWLQLDDTHAAITPGTYLTADTSNPGRYVISATATPIVAFESRALNETGYILAFRYPGKPF